jgi:hypothetical protein
MTTETLWEAIQADYTRRVGPDGPWAIWFAQVRPELVAGTFQLWCRHHLACQIVERDYGRRIRAVVAHVAPGTGVEIAVEPRPHEVWPEIPAMPAKRRQLSVRR